MNDRVVRIFPFLRWFPLDRATIKADTIAGVTVALLLIPQSLAYAQLAGLPPHYGLYAAFLPVMVAALFGWCHQLHTGPVAMASLLTAAVLSSLADVESERLVQLAVLLCLMTGVIRLLLGLLRMSFFVNFLSHSVIVGFTNAAAIIIALSQVGKLLGLPMGRSELFLYDVWEVVVRAGQADVPTLCFSVAALVMIYGLRRWRPMLPGVLIAVVVSTVASFLSGFADLPLPNGVEPRIVGLIPAGLPGFQFPEIEWNTVRQLLPSACLIALIGFAEVVAVTSAVSIKTGQRLNFNQELIGQGLAGIVGGLFQSYPVSGSFSRTALNFAAGARTGFSSVVAALAVLILLLFLTPLLHFLPRSVLAAAIVASVLGLVDFSAMRRAWQAGLHDGLTAWFVFFACILFAPMLTHGVLLGAALAIALHICRGMNPRVAILAQHADGTLRDAERHGLTPDDEIVAIRFERSLSFINAAAFDEAVIEALREFPKTRHLLVVGDGINEVDSSGAEVIRSVYSLLRERGIELHFSGLKWPVMETLTKTGILPLIGEEHFFRTSQAALESLRQAPLSGPRL